MHHVRVGIKTTLGDMSYLRSFLTWHDLMLLAEKDHQKKYDTDEGKEMFKKNTDYENCSDEDDLVKWFWNVFNAFNYEDKKAYMNFVSGKSRCMHVLEKARFFKRHRIVKKSDKPEGDVPTSKPSDFELVLASSYASQDQLKEKLLEAINKGCGLEPDRD